MENSFHILVKLQIFIYTKHHLRKTKNETFYEGISWDGCRLEWIVRDDMMSSIECVTILKFVMHPTVVRIFFVIFMHFN
jgi:hypothetical protein